MKEDKKKKYDTLIISCGGMKGCSAISFLQTIQKYITYNEIRNYYGSSIGGLIVSFLVIGYTIEEIYQIFYYLNFSNFQEFQIKYLVELGGLDNGDKFNRLLISIFQYKNVSPTITFQELYNQSGKNLYLTGTNLTTGSSVYFSHFSHPNMPIILAIRITSCIPFLYIPIEYDGEKYIDGGVLEPMPIPIKKQENAKNAKILAILLQENPINRKNNKNSEQNGRKGEQFEQNKNVMEYGMMIFNLYFMKQLRQSLENFEGDLIEIKLDDHFLFEFELSRAHKRILFQQGEKLGEKFIDDWMIYLYHKKQLHKYFHLWHNNITNNNK
jgi:predicted acylesterase/phospholipase RssA